MRQVTVKQGQNIFDISLQEFGTIEGVFDIIRDNPNLTNSFPEGYLEDSFFSLEMAHNITAGTILNITEDRPVKKYITEILKQTSVISD